MLQRAVRLGHGYPAAITAVVILALAMLPFRALLQPSAFMLVAVLAIVTVARISGVGASAAAAVVAFLALDFLYVTPYYQLTVSKSSELLVLLVFLVVAILAGQQTARLQARERGALERQTELELLNGMSARIVSSPSPESLARFTVERLAEVMAAERVAIYLASSGERPPSCAAEAGAGRPSADEAPVLAAVLRTGEPHGLPGAGTSGSANVAVPLTASGRVEGVLVANLGTGRLTPDRARLLLAVANLAAAALERQRLTDEASQAQATAEADRLKATLVSSVSHELKTPLAAATMRITGLLDEGAALDPERTRAELQEASADLTRLDSAISDLIIFSRLESDSWRPRVEPHDVSEVLGLVYDRLPAFQRERVSFSLAQSLPAPQVDLTQMSRAISNLLINALVYSPPDEPVVLGSAERGDAIAVWVEDRGPGVTDRDKERVFDKFYRGSSAVSAPGGTGLGLAIASEIVRNHGGRIIIEDVHPTGARFVVLLPGRKDPDAATRDT